MEALRCLVDALLDSSAGVVGTRVTRPGLVATNTDHKALNRGTLRDAAKVATNTDHKALNRGTLRDAAKVEGIGASRL